ncbi:hypothetical protein F4604DRAFT_1918593 [Suillus subluteus]|nr:hypothetical protein F4604DRAFT_1918593 [Suillus subluteus]
MSKQNSSNFQEAQQWLAVQAKARAASCEIHSSNPHAYDVTGPSSSQGTGTLVDKEYGFVLTNKHVVGDGPWVGYCVFEDNKQYRAIPVYRDPIHDFAFVKIVADDGKPINPDVLPDALPLQSGNAYTGCAIQVISNARGMKNTVVRGIIGRIDCNPPELDTPEGQDYNIDYIAVAMTAAGGSSGTLSFDINGKGVALMCSGDRTAMAYMLPVHLPEKALECLRKKTPVLRGTLQTHWELLPLNEGERLGLDPKWSDELRLQKAYSAIYVKAVVSKGLLDLQVTMGDILLQINGQLVKSLRDLELELDANVGQTINLKLWSVDKGHEYELQIIVDNLHSHVPHRLVTLGDAVFLPVSFQVALRNNIPIQGVYVSKLSQGPFRPMHLIESIQNQATENIEKLAEVLDKVQNDIFITVHQKPLGDCGTAVPCTGYFSATNPLVDIQMSRKQGSAWNIMNVREPPRIIATAQTPVPKEGSAHDELEAANTSVPNNDTSEVADIFHSIVQFNIHRTVGTDGVNCNPRGGYGLVWNARRGLVVAAHDNLTLFDEIVMTVGSDTDIRAQVLFLHPALNLAVLKFNPASVSKHLIHACVFKAEEDSLTPGREVHYAPFVDYLNKSLIETKIESMDEGDGVDHWLPPDKRPQPAHFIPFCHTTCQLQARLGRSQMTGVLLNKNRKVAALLLSHGHCISSATLQKAMGHILSGQTEHLRFRDFDVSQLPLSIAFNRGLDRKWRNERHKVLTVARVPLTLVGSTEPHPLLRGDIILELNKQPVMEAIRLEYQYEQEEQTVRVFRGDQELEVKVPTLSLADVTVDTAAQFCGIWMQRPSLALHMSHQQLLSEIYTTEVYFGSPSEKYGLQPQAFVIAIEGSDISNLKGFLECISEIPYNKYFRVRIQYANHRPNVFTIEKNTFFPTVVKRMTTTYSNGTLRSAIVDSELWEESHENHFAGY